jgi:hypothetical protein
MMTTMMILNDDDDDDYDDIVVLSVQVFVFTSSSTVNRSHPDKNPEQAKKDNIPLSICPACSLCKVYTNREPHVRKNFV